MAKLTNPPPHLAQIPPEISKLPAGTELWRIYKRGGDHPVLWDSFRAFGPLRTGRFDHHLPGEDGSSRLQDRMILYAATQITTCLAEFFQGTRTISREAEHPWLVGFQLHLDVVLLDLTGAWPTRAGTSMAINSGPRSRCRLWSRAVYEAYPQLQGLYYASSMHGNRPSFALYEHAQPALPTKPIFNRPLSDPALLGDLDRSAQILGYRLI